VARALDFTGLSSGERSQILIANLHTPLFSRYHFHPRGGISLFGLSALTWRGIIKRSNTRAIYSALLSGGSCINQVKGLFGGGGDQRRERIDFINDFIRIIEWNRLTKRRTSRSRRPSAGPSSDEPDEVTISGTVRRPRKSQSTELTNSVSVKIAASCCAGESKGERDRGMPWRAALFASRSGGDRIRSEPLREIVV